ncbi:hypothetical protein EVAR_3973_1 [Eumeta japonica]|uniref:Uncharacterized protein n=1 Tax=Eumeta variegata TaxID=151549 RepID=A0A4C1SUA9_EUMVA|nr:hypothetical protein EVAR_3973_1 [Eumeta japonica]
MGVAETTLEKLIINYGVTKPRVREQSGARLTGLDSFNVFFMNKTREMQALIQNDFPLKIQFISRVTWLLGSYARRRRIRKVVPCPLCAGLF